MNRQLTPAFAMFVAGWRTDMPRFFLEPWTNAGGRTVLLIRDHLGRCAPLVVRDRAHAAREMAWAEANIPRPSH